MDYTGTLMLFVLKLVSVALDYQDGGIPPDKVTDTSAKRLTRDASDE